MDALLNLVPAAERPRVQEKARRLAAAARDWAAPARAELGTPVWEPIAVVVAGLSPGLADERALLLVRYSLCTMLLDDRLEDAGAGRDARRLARSVRDALGGAPGPDFLGRALAGVHADLHRLAGDGPALRRFAAALLDAVQAELLHLQYVRSGHWHRRLTLERHLELGARNVNYRGFGLALLLVTAGQPDPDLLDLADRALVPGATAVRLANDLRAPERDRRQGRPNALDLRTREGTPVTAADVRQRIAVLAGRHDELLDRYPGADQEPVRALRASLRLALGVYEVTDLAHGRAA